MMGPTPKGRVPAGEPFAESGSVQHSPGSWESVILPGAMRALWECFVTFSLAGLAGNTSKSGLMTWWTHTSCFGNLDEPGGSFANYSLCWLVEVDGRTRWESDQSAAPQLGGPAMLPVGGSARPTRMNSKRRSSGRTLFTPRRRNSLFIINPKSSRAQNPMLK
jgi:hypothetical protein